MQTEHIHSLNLLYITLKLIVVLLEHQVDMISIFQRLTELGLNLLWNRQTKSDLDETFTEASDGCCLKPNQTIQNQTKLSLSLFL